METRSLLSRFAYIASALISVSLSQAQNPDAFGDSIPIGQGEMPGLTIDANETLHLVYARSGALYYRTGSTDGDFGEEELIFESHKLHDPRIVVDAQNNPHVVVADGHYKNRFTYYTNRIGGHWKPILDVFDKERDNLNRATMPSILLEDDNSALVGIFTVGDASETTQQWGAIARIKDLSAEPKVAIRRKIDVWNPQLLLRNGEIWVGGRNKINGKRRFTFQQHNNRTLDEIGDPIAISEKVHGEAGRAVLGQTGELHAAGSVGGVPAEVRGWYNTLSRAEKGLSPIRYKTSLENPCGMGMPVEDLKAPGRVYVFYWSDVSGDSEEHEHKTCLDHEQLHFVRIENGEKASELNPVTNRKTGHGPHYRLTPAAIPNPEGGAIVVFRECDGNLFLSKIGAER